jgi:hypothetical protein
VIERRRANVGHCCQEIEDLGAGSFVCPSIHEVLGPPLSYPTPSKHPGRGSGGITFWAFCTGLLCGTARGLLRIYEGPLGRFGNTAPSSSGVIPMGSKWFVISSPYRASSTRSPGPLFQRGELSNFEMRHGTRPVRGPQRASVVVAQQSQPGSARRGRRAPRSGWLWGEGGRWSTATAGLGSPAPVFLCFTHVPSRALTLV